MTITILLIPTNLKVRKEALNGFIEGYSMLSEFVPLEIILDKRWSEPMPIDHSARFKCMRYSVCKPVSPCGSGLVIAEKESRNPPIWRLPGFP